jgi:hypothetical protein
MGRRKRQTAVPYLDAIRPRLLAWTVSSEAFLSQPTQYRLSGPRVT